MKKQTKSMTALRQDTYLGAGNEGYLDSLYEVYLEKPEMLSHEWRSYFDNLQQAYPRTQPEISHQAIIETISRPSLEKTRQFDLKQEGVLHLINAYRRLGHLAANIDPLELNQKTGKKALEISNFGLSQQDLDKQFEIDGQQIKLADLIDRYEKIYCGSIGFEYLHINRSDEVAWIQKRIEHDWFNFQPSAAEKKKLLEKLVVADGLEKYLGFKYVGQKRFSLEGGDALIPLLDTVVQRGAGLGIQEVTIGMAHRGRLNVLVNVVGKKSREIFDAFEGKGIMKTHFSGDVKYHLGYASNVKTAHGLVHIALAFNPSHLEIVSPVAQGSVRARQRRRRDTEQLQVIPIQIHGDASFAGQGVVMETFNMSQARWFTVGGSIHIVINNQIGFTISNIADSRSTTYCTDVAKMVEPPILHVNGNDPEAVYFAACFAIDYRQQFKRDIVIDLVCYRRHGHNEADEPSATQPLMYQKIKAMPVPYIIYAQQLLAEHVIQPGEEKELAASYRQALDEGKLVVEVIKDDSSEYAVNWEPFEDKPWDQTVKTAVPLKRLKSLAQALEKLPEGFVLQPQVKKVLEAQKKMTAGEMPLNWGYAETLAYATLLTEGYPIRLCGQDSARGTFAHRHAVLHDQKNDQVYIPLSHLADKQSQINIVDSLLSEEAVMAFEYGYASAEPNFLVIWEAQYGDFANGAQVVIDQFISSGEQKWGRLCGLVLLLPHGYEGSGPEHSSARLERYLQLCAQENMQVCVPTTPAQIFHLFRRQMLRAYRKPLIVMSPKSMLRHPNAVSSLEDLSEGSFQLVIPEIESVSAVKRVILCCGKVYYELLAARKAQQLKNIAIIRIEQLYPFPMQCIQKIMKPYSNVKDIVWCQEEPQNQGAWLTMQPYLSSILGEKQSLRYVGRQASASPAVGYHAIHEKEQKELVAQALAEKGSNP